MSIYAHQIFNAMEDLQIAKERYEAAKNAADYDDRYAERLETAFRQYAELVYEAATE